MAPVQIIRLAHALGRKLSEYSHLQEQLERARETAREQRHGRLEYVKSLAALRTRVGEVVGPDKTAATDPQIILRQLYGGREVPLVAQEELEAATAERDRCAGRIGQLCRRLRVPAESIGVDGAALRSVCLEWESRIKQIGDCAFRTCFSRSIRQILRAGWCESGGMLYDSGLLEAVWLTAEALRDKVARFRAIADRATPAPSAELPNANPGKTLTKEAKAVAALVDHPEWTDEQIAQAAGCNRQSLYRMRKFVRAKARLKDHKDVMPRGSKDGESGDVEAWHNSGDDE